MKRNARARRVRAPASAPSGHEHAVADAADLDEHLAGGVALDHRAPHRADHRRPLPRQRGRDRALVADATAPVARHAGAAARHRGARHVVAQRERRARRRRRAGSGTLGQLRGAASTIVCTCVLVGGAVAGDRELHLVRAVLRDRHAGARRPRASASPLACPTDIAVRTFTWNSTRSTATALGPELGDQRVELALRASASRSGSSSLGGVRITPYATATSAPPARGAPTPYPQRDRPGSMPEHRARRDRTRVRSYGWGGAAGVDPRAQLRARRRRRAERRARGARRTTATGASRLRTSAPAASRAGRPARPRASRSSAARSRRRRCGRGPGRRPSPLDDRSPAGRRAPTRRRPLDAARLAAAGAGAARGRPTSTSRSRFSTNWPSSLLDTSAITPRPNCATLPVMLRSVSMSTVVPSPSAVERRP